MYNKRTEYTLQSRKSCRKRLNARTWFFLRPVLSYLFLSPDSLAYFLYHIRVILVCLIFFCSWKMPNMSASAVGGQPGT